MCATQKSWSRTALHNTRLFVFFEYRRCHHCSHHQPSSSSLAGAAAAAAASTTAANTRSHLVPPLFFLLSLAPSRAHNLPTNKKDLHFATGRLRSFLTAYTPRANETLGGERERELPTPIHNNIISSSSWRHYRRLV